MSQDPKFDFSRAIEELEQINHWFQNEDIDLDQGLAKFRRGLELIKKCRGRLKQVENEFVEIKKEFNTDEKKTSQSDEPEKAEEQTEAEESDVDTIPF